MNKNLAVRIVFIVNIIVHIIVGASLIIFSNEAFERNNLFIGAIILVTGLPNLFIYLIGKGYRELLKQPYLVFSIVSVVIGVIFMLCDEISLLHMCIIWGIHDICRSAYEIFDGIRELRHDKLEILEIIAGVADLTLGVLLCIEKEEGIKMHLIIMGIALVLIGIRFLIELIITIKESKKESKHA